MGDRKCLRYKRFIARVKVNIFFLYNIDIAYNDNKLIFL